MLKNILFIILIILPITMIAFFIIPPKKALAQKLDFNKSYNFYKKHYMTPDGRIFDPDRDYITTSEGQAYMLLMSRAINDKKTFDLVYGWTKKHLRRKDSLHSWLWAKDHDGRYKVMDYNSASDADIDIAKALILAYNTWKEDQYLKDAKLTINGIWKHETRKIGKHLVLMPGPIQAKSEIIEINPSYFAIYSFKLFKQYDPKHDWDKLVDSSYYYLNALISESKTGLPPNWFYIVKGKIVIENSERGDFSYDAIRVFWRVFNDYKLTGDKRALPVLAQSKIFINEWKKSNNLYVIYDKNGKKNNTAKPVGSIAILLPVIKLYDKKVAAEIFAKEIVPYFSEKGYWAEEHNYYGKNLLWFGEYMYIYEKTIHQ